MIIEFRKAKRKEKEAKELVNHSFKLMSENCEDLTKQECIGFEGILVNLCTNKKHPYINSMYPTCCVKECPNGL